MQKLFNLLNSSNHLSDTPDFMIYKASPIFDHAHTTIKVTFCFLKFVSTFKKSAHFITRILESQDLKGHTHF